MKRALVVVLGLCVMSALAFAQAKPEAKPETKPEAKAGDLTDPVEILKKVDAATKAVKFVKYNAVVEGTGALAARVGKVEGTVVMSGWANNNVEKFRCEAKVSQPGSADVQDVVAGSDGKMFFAIDHKGKKAFENASPLTLGKAGNAARQLLMAEFVHPTPFNDEIEGKNHALKGTKKIGEEECYEIQLEYSKTPQQVVWFVSKKDFLPRAVDRLEKDGSRKWTITNLVIDPKSDKDPFKLEVPEGYTRATEGAGP